MWTPSPCPPVPDWPVAWPWACPAPRRWPGAANKPIYGINHVIGHIAVTQLQFGPFPKDTLALIVSGGHTSLLHVEDMPRKIDVVGTTLDDAAGECFDKVARLLGFPYPGGPHIDRHGQNGDPHAIKVPMGLTQRQGRCRAPV